MAAGRSDFLASSAHGRFTQNCAPTLASRGECLTAVPVSAKDLRRNNRFWILRLDEG